MPEQLWTSEAEAGGRAALVMTGISHQVASAKEGPELSGKVGQRSSSAELPHPPPSMGVSNSMNLRNILRTGSFPALCLKHHHRWAGPWIIWPEGVITHIATANPIVQSFRETLAWSLEARGSQSSLKALSSLLCPGSLCVLQGSMLSTFRLFLYLLNSWIQQVSHGLYSMPATVQGLEVGKMNKTCPCTVFWEISVGTLICRSWKYCWQFLFLSLTYSQSNMWQNVRTWKYLMTECVHAKSLSHVQLLVTPWIVACQAPLSMGILHARILEWVAMPSFRESSQPRDWTQVLYH